MDWNSWFKYYILNIDSLIVICVVLVVLYFIVTGKRKKYKFQGYSEESFDLDDIRKKNSKGKKRAPGPKVKGAKLNKHEEECRRIFQDLYGVKFKSIRPAWLKNPVTGKNLELDGFASEILTPLGRGLAFEYDGKQHSEFNSHFHKSGPNEFIYQVKKDSWKDMRCKQNKIVLIRIPHFVAFQDLRRYITTELQRQNVQIQRYGTSSGGNFSMKDNIYS